MPKSAGRRSRGAGKTSGGSGNDDLAPIAEGLQLLEDAILGDRYDPESQKNSVMGKAEHALAASQEALATSERTAKRVDRVEKRTDKLEERLDAQPPPSEKVEAIDVVSKRTQNWIRAIVGIILSAVVAFFGGLFGWGSN